jgi:hypothetical protein
MEAISIAPCALFAFEYPERLPQIRRKPAKGTSLFTGRENQWN